MALRNVGSEFRTPSQQPSSGQVAPGTRLASRERVARPLVGLLLFGPQAKRHRPTSTEDIGSAIDRTATACAIAASPGCSQ
jgi:hypothetical protein